MCSKCPKGKATSVIVEDPFDEKETLQGINDFAATQQSEICLLPRTTIQGHRYHSNAYNGWLKVQGLCVCVCACVCVCVCVCVYVCVCV